MVLVKRWSVFVAVSSLVAVGAAPVAHAASVTAAPSPYVAVKHVRLLNGTVKKSTATSFALKGIPVTGVTSVVLSVTVTGPAASGSLVSYPYGAKRPHAVSLAFGKGHSATGLVVVSAGKNGRAALFNASTASEHIAATVVGYYAAPGVTKAATAFKPVTPKQLASVLVKAKSTAAFAAAGKLGVPVVDTAGVVVAVTTTPSSGSGSVVLLQYGAKHGTPVAFTAGRPRTTLVVVTPGSKGRVQVSTTSKHPVRVVLDVVGYLSTLHVPGAPTAVTATAGDKSALVSWKAPASNGGAPIASYTVTANPGGITAQASGTATSVLVRGLTVGTAYTFTVVAANSRGTGAASPVSTAATPFTTPDAPQGGFAVTGGYGQVLIIFSLSGVDGGLPETSARLTASPGGAVMTMTPKGGAYELATFGGLTPGTTYTFTIIATNAAGDSAPSPSTLPVQAGGISRVSVASTGAQGNDGSLDNGLSADGRYVVFDSLATNLVSGDPGGHFDVFVRDRVTGSTTVVSVAHDGGFGDGNSFQPSISADGRFVAFSSLATDLTNTTIGGHFEVYVRDLQLGTTKLISASAGVAADGDSSSPVISADGTTIAFISKAGNLLTVDAGAHQQVYAADRQSGDLTAVSVGTGSVEANGDSAQPVISGDGKIVAWTSKATNLVSPVIPTTHQQVFQRVLTSSTTSMLSSISGVAGDQDAQDPSISTDGSYSAFDSAADNLSGVPDTNGVPDVFTCFKGCTSPQLMDLGPFGAPANRGAFAPSLSQSGSLVAYSSTSTDLATGVVPTVGVPQVFVTAWSSRKTIAASVLGDGTLGNASSGLPHLTADGAHVSFFSSATNLVPGDSNLKADVFVADLPSSAAGGLPSF